MLWLFVVRQSDEEQHGTEVELTPGLRRRRGEGKYVTDQSQLPLRFMRPVHRRSLTSENPTRGRFVDTVNYIWNLIIFVPQFSVWWIFFQFLCLFFFIICKIHHFLFFSLYQSSLGSDQLLFFLISHNPKVVPSLSLLSTTSFFIHFTPGLSNGFLFFLMILRILFQSVAIHSCDVSKSLDSGYFNTLH